MAGNMFYARVDAFRPLLQMGFSESSFEAECGQKDGTLAHALERLTALTALVAGYRVGALCENINVVNEAVLTDAEYPFAVRTG